MHSASSCMYVCMYNMSCTYLVERDMFLAALG